MVPLRSIAAALVLTPSLASAGAEPPEKYSRPAANAWIIERTPEQIRELCGQHSPWAEGPGACALPGKRCIILWPKDRPRSGWLWLHEHAHCNGWPATHPSK